MSQRVENELVSGVHRLDPLMNTAVGLSSVGIGLASYESFIGTAPAAHLTVAALLGLPSIVSKISNGIEKKIPTYREALAWGGGITGLWVGALAPASMSQKVAILAAAGSLDLLAHIKTVVKRDLRRRKNIK